MNFTQNNEKMLEKVGKKNEKQLKNYKEILTNISKKMVSFQFMAEQ